jgi:hypothetical protein
MTVTETAVDTRVRQRREATVREHVDAENRHDPDATVATFSVGKARYDIPGFGEAGEVPDHDAIREMFTGMFTVFPDFHIDAGPLRHGDDPILVEVRLSGAQHADWAGIPNTGRSFNSRMAAIFDFGEIARQLSEIPWGFRLDGGVSTQDRSSRTNPTSMTASGRRGRPQWSLAVVAGRAHIGIDQSARCTEPSAHHDHTSSVTNGSTGANRRSKVFRAVMSAARADSVPAPLCAARDRGVLPGLVRLAPYVHGKSRSNRSGSLLAGSCATTGTSTPKTGVRTVAPNSSW